MSRITGGSAPAEFWRGFMSVALKRLPVQTIPLGPPPPAPLIPVQTAPVLEPAGSPPPPAAPAQASSSPN
jgi:penicillin-binding protein 1A